MKQNNEQVKLLNLILILMLVGMLALFYIIIDAKIINFNFKTEKNSIQEILDDCNGLNLENTADCLRDNIGTFFKFTITSDAIKLSFEEIKENGGDCKDWSELYNELCLGLDYNCKMVTLSTGKVNHRILIMSDDSGYCVLDQLNLECFIDE